MSSNGTSDLARKVLADPRVAEVRARLDGARAAEARLKSQGAQRELLLREADGLSKEAEQLAYDHEVGGLPRDDQRLAALAQQIQSKRAASEHMKPPTAAELEGLAVQIRRDTALLGKLTSAVSTELVMPPLFKAVAAAVDGFLGERSNGALVTAELKQILSAPVSLDDGGLAEALQAVWTGPLGHKQRWESPSEVAGREAKEQADAKRRQAAKVRRLESYAAHQEALARAGRLPSDEKRKNIERKKEMLGV